ncbi:MAG: hypothetical protein LH613_08700 [Chamaesiphon sp.]|nr:hypothetical protein [Chamaesiphon sp.]
MQKIDIRCKTHPQADPIVVASGNDTHAGALCCPVCINEGYAGTLKWIGKRDPLLLKMIDRPQSKTNSQSVQTTLFDIR